MIILPGKLDVEASAQWTPASASTDNYQVKAYRVSAWWRLSSKSTRALEVYAERFSRLDADRERKLPVGLQLVEFIDQACALRAPVVDANTLLYMVRANQLAGADPARIKAPTLIVHSPTDLVFPQPWIERTAAAIEVNMRLTAALFRLVTEPVMPCPSQPGAIISSGRTTRSKVSASSAWQPA